MVFRRRDRRTPFRIVRDAVYPRGGWGRALSYISYRLRRLPDPPGRIARGIACGVFVCFTPLFGFHFIFSALLALMIRGNVVAALLATAFGNPLTFPVIAVISMRIGTWLLGPTGAEPSAGVLESFSGAFGEAMANLIRLITGGDPEWGRLQVFFESVFLPYTLGGLIPGLICATAFYWLSLPVIEAYQKRRRRIFAGRVKRRLKRGAEDPGPTA